jgi:Protein of unknown function (DUF4031)
MTVYVDDMYKYPMGQFGRMKMSHMIADTEEELHTMADKIGLNRRWYQGDHYDVAMITRTKAVAFGAVEITIHQLSAMSVLRRRGFKMPSPETAMADLLAVRHTP